MIAVIEEVLKGEELSDIRKMMDDHNHWKQSTLTPGKGHQKNWEMYVDTSPHCQKVLGIIGQRIVDDQKIRALSLMDFIFPPKFNKYRPGDYFETHCDEPLTRDGNSRTIRADIAYTLFLSDPTSYRGGELVIMDEMSDPFKCKGNPGDLVLYPADYVHSVTEVLEGVRYAVVGWIQSLVPSVSYRVQILKVNTILERLLIENGPSDNTAFLESHRNFLLRLWGR